MKKSVLISVIVGFIVCIVYRILLAKKMLDEKNAVENDTENCLRN